MDRELVWHRPGRCDTGSCILVAFDGDKVLVRDSKLGDDSPVIEYTRDEWRNLLGTIVLGGNPTDVHPLTRPWPDGPGYCWERDLVHLHFDTAEVEAFFAGAKAGEFDHAG